MRWREWIVAAGLVCTLVAAGAQPTLSEASSPAADDDGGDAQAVAELPPPPSEEGPLLEAAEDTPADGEVEDADDGESLSEEAPEEDEPLSEPIIRRVSCRRQRKELEEKALQLEAKVEGLMQENQHLRKQREEARRHASREAVQLHRLRQAVARQAAPAWRTLAKSLRASRRSAQPEPSPVNEANGVEDALAPPAAGGAVALGARPKVKDGRMVTLRMPWLLAHTGTRHRQARSHAHHRLSTSWDPTGTMANIFNRVENGLQGFRDMAGGTSYDSLRSEQHEAVTDAMLSAELQQCREDLGRTEQAKLQLQKQMDRKEQSDAAAREEEVRREVQEAQDSPDAEAKVQDRIAAKVQERIAAAVEKTRQELESKMQAQEKELESKMQAQEKAAETQRVALQSQLQAAESEVHLLQNRSGEVGYQKDMKDQELQMEEQNEEQQLKDEAKQLHGMQSAEERCMSWGKHLEAKLQHVLESRQNDARLCRDSIMSLHAERQKLQERDHRLQVELKSHKQKLGQAEKQSTEDQELLNRCLDQLQPR